MPRLLEPGDRPGAWSSIGDLTQRVGKLEAVPEASAPSGGGIDFNKENTEDALGVSAGYLWLNYSNTALPFSTYSGVSGTNYGPLTELHNDTGHGGMVDIQNGGGMLGWRSTGNGAAILDGGGTVSRPDKTVFDTFVDGSGHSLTNQFMWADGTGCLYFHQTEGPIIFENEGVGGIHLWSSGSDWYGATVKISIAHAGDSFLIQHSQTITRDGSGNITGQTPVNPALEIAPGSTTAMWFYALPTADPSSTDQLWLDHGAHVASGSKILSSARKYLTVQTGVPSTFSTPLVYDNTAVTGGLYGWDSAAYQKIGPL